MNTLRGIIHNGQVVLPQPTDLPEGTEVEVVPLVPAWETGDEPTTDDEIIRTLAAMDAVEPFEFTDQEREAIAADRRRRKEWEKAHFNDHAERLREIWGMRRFLLDTGIAGDYINRRRGVFERARQEAARGNRVGIGMPVLAELAYGIELSTSRDRNTRNLRIAVRAWKLWPFDDKAAFEYGLVAAELRRIGRPMQQIDVMIAAIAFALGSCTVVTGDSDLAAVPGLDVENWADL